MSILMEHINKFMNDPLARETLRYKPDKIKGRSKPKAVKDHKRRNEQPRNELCNCGSGKKFKKCCGKVVNDD